MSNPSCPNFILGGVLNKTLNIDKNLSNEIASYNQYATKYGLELIDDDKYLSLKEEDRASLVEKYTNLLGSYIYVKRGQEVLKNASSWDELRLMVGTGTAAYLAVTTIFTPEERHSFRTELHYLLSRISPTGSGRETISSYNIIDIIKEIKECYNWSIGNIDALLESIDTSTEEGRREKVDLLARRDLCERISSNIAYLFISNLAEFKKLYGKSFDLENESMFDVQNENDIMTEEELTFDVEEAIKERWQTVLDSIDPSGSLSHIINEILFTTPVYRVRYEYKDGEYRRVLEESNTTQALYLIEEMSGNRLEIPLASEPRIEARKLLNILSSCTSIKTMMAKLESLPQYKSLYLKLKDDPRLQTTFLESFRRYHIDYYMTSDSNGTVVDKPLNTYKADLTSSFFYKLNSFRTVPTSNSVFFSSKRSSDKNPVTINKEQLRVFGLYLKDSLGEDFNLGDFSKFYNESSKVKRGIIEVILSFLNIDINENTADTIMSDDITLNSFLTSVSTLNASLNRAASTLSKASDKAASIGASSALDIAAIRSIFAKPKDSTEVNPSYTALSTVLDIVDSSNEFSSSFSGMVSYKTSKGTKTLATNIQMSQLSELLDTFNNYSPEELRGLLEEVYGVDECIYDRSTRKFRIKWLQDIYDSCDSDSKRSFSNIIKLSRTLGFNETEFENISDKGHMLSILSMYFSGLSESSQIEYIDREVTSVSDLKSLLVKTNRTLNPKTYYYPTNSVKAYRVSPDEEVLTETVRTQTCTIPMFITGDTLSLRGVKSLHYSEEEIIDGIYQFYLSDIFNRKKIAAFNAAGLSVSGNNKENYTKKGDKFGFCKFLEEGYIAHAKDEKGNWVEIPGLYNSWMMNEGNGVAQYSESSIKEIIKIFLNNEAEYFYEVRLPQLGISTKDLAKLKGNSGESFAEKLKDFYYNYRFSQYNQTAMVDISPSFFDNSKVHQKRNKVTGTNGQIFVIDAIDPQTNEPVWEGSNPTQNVVYFSDIALKLSDYDRAFLEAIGLDPTYIDKTYGHNTISDGQAWRSFKSWRKIGLSFGKDVWTDEMEDAYHLINNYASKIRELETELDKLEATRNSIFIESSTEEILKVGGELGTLQEQYKEAKSKQKEFKKKHSQLSSELETLRSELRNITVIFQARKPVCNGIESYFGASVPFQFKYAEIPIIPCLYPKGSTMRELGEYMESHNIDLLASSRCGKKGVFGEISLQYKVNKLGLYVDSSNNVIDGYTVDGVKVSSPTRAEQLRNPNFEDLAVENLDGDLSISEMLDRQLSIGETGGAYNDINPFNQTGGKVVRGVIHQCPLRTYLIQNNVPDHTLSPTLFGNQIRKIALGAISKDESYNFNINGSPRSLSGSQVLALFNALVSANFINSFGKFESSLTNRKKVIGELTSNILGNDRCDLNTIAKLAGGVPFWDPTVQDDIFATLVSMFKHAVISQHIEGGSIVQASSLGSDISLRSYLGSDLKFEVDKNGYPTRCECVIPFNFKYIDDLGDTVYLDYNDYCNEDGTFKQNEDGSLKIETEFPGILDIEAYRIPTERLYSCFHLHVVRCCPRVGANYIQLPSICTSRAGFDFDIDKLFLIRKTFDATKSDRDLEKIWDKIYEEYNIAEDLETARSSATTEEIEKIKETYTDKGMEAPKTEDIPLNRFWNIAKKRGLLEGLDKSQIFTEVARAHPELITSNEFSSTDVLDKDGNVNLESLFNSKTPKGDIDNILLELILQITTLPQQAKNSFTAGGFSTTTASAKSINGIKALDSKKVSKSNDGVMQVDLSDPEILDSIEEFGSIEEDFDFSDPFTAIKYNQLNQAAAKLIGIYANDSSNFNTFSNTHSVVWTGVPIRFGSLVYTNNEQEVNGQNMLVKFANGMSIDSRLAELLAASVDAVKDPVLNYLNLNEVTGEAASVLIRMGYTTQDVGLLFNQPIIVETLQLMSREGISNVTAALDIVLKNHNMGTTAKLKERPIIHSKYLESGSLAYNLTKDAITDEGYYAASQIGVACIFINLMQIKDEYNTIVQLTRNTSSNVVKTNLADYFALKSKLDKYRENPNHKIQINLLSENEGNITFGSKETAPTLKTKEDKISYYKDFINHPFAFEAVVGQLIDRVFSTLVNAYTPFNSGVYSGIIDVAAKLCGYGSMSSDTFNMIFKDAINIILSSLNGDLNPSCINPDKTINPNGLTNAELYLKHIDSFYQRAEEYIKSYVPKTEDGSTLEVEDIEYAREDLQNMLGRFAANSKILGERIVVDPTSASYTQLFFKSLFNLTKDQKSDISASWESLSRFGEDEGNESNPISDLAKAIALHLYYSYGFKNSREFSVNFIPLNVLQSIKVSYNNSTVLSYIEFMDEMQRVDLDGNSAADALSNCGVTASTILAKCILQHLDNKQYCFVVTDSFKDKFEANADGSVITVSMQDSYLVTHKVSGDRRRYATPFIIKDGVIYQLHGYNLGNGSCAVSKKQAIIYERVSMAVNESVASFFNDRNGYLYGYLNSKVSWDSASIEDAYVSEDSSEDETEQPKVPLIEAAVRKTEETPTTLCGRKE